MIRDVFVNIHSCPGIMSKQRKILRDAKSRQLKPQQVFILKIDNFRSHFRILGKNFKNNFARNDSEAIFIRTTRPDINSQMDFKCFLFFLKMDFIFFLNNFSSCRFLANF